MRIRQGGQSMYRLADIDFSKALVISSREPMPDEVDRQDDTLQASPVWSSGKELEKAVFRAA
jgi:hypothetical protein